MPCSHSDPPDIMRKAEEWLRRSGVPEEKWSGMKIRHGENTPGERWQSVVIEIERRGREWIVTAIDRRNEALAPDALGLTAH
jgi:hypothetical protein